MKNGLTRKVPLTSRAIAILRDAVDTIPVDRWNRVFPLEANKFAMRFRRIRKRASKEMPSLADFRFHDTRHEAISRAAKKIKSTVVLARVTGHRDPKTLLRYVNPTGEELAAMLE